MAYRTLTEIESDVRYRFDIEGFTARHSQASLFRAINDAARKFRDSVTSSGASLFLSTTEGLQTTVERTAGYPGTLLSQVTFGSHDIVHSVDVLGTDQRWSPLRHVNYHASLYDTDGVTADPPESWCIAGGSGFTGAAITGNGLNIVVMPALEQVRTFRIFGLKSWVDLVATDRIATDHGLIDCVIAEVGVIVCNRDSNPELFQFRVKERNELLADALKRARQRAPAPVQRVDVHRRYRR